MKLTVPLFLTDVASRFSWQKHGRLWVYIIAMMVAAVAMSLWLGRDTPWDYFSYHAYAAHLLFHPRWAQDYFAAGMQGYMNPLGYLPFALAQKAGLDSIGTATVLACGHALNGVFLLLLCRDLSRLVPRQAALLVPGLLLGVTTPILLAHLGSTFTDPLGSACVLAALWLATTRRSRKSHFVAGLAVALSLAIKLSNLVFALAVALAMLWPWRESLRDWFLRNLSGALGISSGMLLFQGYWSLQLYRHTGNPLFPLFNGWFRSPLIPQDAETVGRFVPRTLADALQVPLELARYSSWSHLELPAPTVLPLLVCLAALAWVLVTVLRRIGQPQRRAATTSSPAYAKLAVFLVVSCIAWLMTSGNSRYGLPLFVVLGPALGLLCGGLFTRRYALLTMWLVVVVQWGITWDAGVKRWQSQKWTRDWASVELPRSLSASPFLFIALTQQAHSELVPHLHPGSSYIHLNNGHYSLPSRGPASVPLLQLIERFQHRTKVVLSRPWTLDSATVGADAAIIANGDNTLDRLSLRIVPGSCVDVPINMQHGYDIRLNRHLPRLRDQVLMVCDADHATPRYAAQRDAMEEIMDAYEDKCPDLFNPSRPQIEKVGDIWVRIYSKYDSAVLLIDPAKGYIAYLLTGQFRGVPIGTPDTWRQDVGRFDCRMPYGGERGFKGFETEMQQQ